MEKNKQDIEINDMSNDEQMMPLFAGGEDDNSPLKCNDGDMLPLLPLRNMVLAPDVITPIQIGRSSSLELVKEANKKKLEIVVATQVQAETEDPGQNDIYTIGTIARVLKVIKLPNNVTTAIISGKRKAIIKDVNNEGKYLKATVELLPEIEEDINDTKNNALKDILRKTTCRVLKESDAPNDLLFVVKNVSTLTELTSFIITNFPLETADKIKALRCDTLTKCAEQLLVLISKEEEIINLKNEIHSKAKFNIDKQQRDYFLQQQLRQIQEELGETSQSEIDDLQRKAYKMKWDNATHETFTKELHKLEHYHPSSPEYAVQLNYLETLLSLPWGITTVDHFDIKKAETILNKDHYGLDKVKQRILEHLAVLKYKGDMKAPILCLYGPPGVGKTSLGRSIATAIGRKYVRMSLGGIHDEAEIRGHRRTYIGAMPGRIIKNLSKAGSANPVFVLDEIDKLAADIKGDPASALLEVLDPEQNSTFHDNFLDIDFDLSNVFFIATANDVTKIPRALRDRMEMIEVNGYDIDEKIEIASKHLIPKQKKEHALADICPTITKNTIQEIAARYTAEAGVRDLDRKIAKLMRTVAFKASKGEELPKRINPGDLKDFLGNPRYDYDKKETAQVGVVNGMAWSSVGGDLLFIESSINDGEGGKLTMTGNLGDVMTESAKLALEFIKAHCKEFGIEYDYVKKHSLHLHFPEGATPKDGPSAGIAILTCLVSTLTGRTVKPNLAMSGEISLRGKVLPVGGLKEKVLAAKRAGITDIILCKKNQNDIEEIEQKYLQGVTFHYVTEMREVLSLALQPA
ncbi:MAG: endopeptidase La [Bacteroidales bacterium]|nr:endopeptidase La [Bacteroidales bacterium]